jgi:hypothetical protein
MAITKNRTSVSKDVAQQQPLYTTGGNVNYYSHLENNRQFLKKLKLPSDLAILLQLQRNWNSSAFPSLL